MGFLLSGMRAAKRSPEFGVVVFSFLLHFVWEQLQTPTYAGMAEMAHWPATLVCAQATLGDVGFALIAFAVTALLARSRRWIAEPRAWQVGLFVLVGVLLTVGFEWYYIEISGRWIYSDLMPRMPLIGTGLSPLAQWLIVPPLVVWFTRRHIGAGAIGA